MEDSQRLDLRKERNNHVLMCFLIMAVIFVVEFWPSATLQTPPASALVLWTEFALHIATAVVLYLLISTKVSGKGAKRKIRAFGFAGSGLLFSVFALTNWLLLSNMLCANFFRISMVFWLVTMTLTLYWWLIYRED